MNRSSRSDSEWTELGPIDDCIDAALREDLGSGDLTARLTVPPSKTARATIVAKQRLVVCGLPIVDRVFARIDPSVVLERIGVEGAVASVGEVLVRLSGSARALLAGERTALNLLGRGCAVATLTRQYVDTAGPTLRVVDTRKTMPGLRVLDRYAVRCGGGHNHRNDLGSGVLIKENHIRCAGSVTAAVRAALEHAPHTVTVECEVTTLDELREAIDAGVESVLLDNMDDATLRDAVEIARGRGVRLEVSGNVTIERLPRLAAIGVDFVSIGALTHSAPNVDLSMKIDIE